MIYAHFKHRQSWNFGVYFLKHFNRFSDKTTAPFLTHHNFTHIKICWKTEIFSFMSFQACIYISWYVYTQQATWFPQSADRHLHPYTSNNSSMLYHIVADAPFPPLTDTLSLGRGWASSYFYLPSNTKQPKAYWLIGPMSLSDSDEAWTYRKYLQRPIWW